MTRRLILTLVSIAMVATPTLATAPVHATEWSISSVYGYEQVWPNVKGFATERITVSVPTNVTSVDYEIDQRASGSTTAHQGFVVLETAQALDQNGDAQPVTLRLNADTGASWETVVPAPTAARTTTLTVTSSAPVKAAAGTTLRLAGTLTAGGQPLTGHWAQIYDYRSTDCSTTGTTSCGYHAVRLGGGQADADGTWKAEIPVQWSASLAATYCWDSSGCWNNQNSPGYAAGPTVKAVWAPSLQGPSRVPAGTRTKVRVKVPAARAGLPVKIQTDRNGKWVTVAKRQTTGDPLTASLRLPAGRHRLRAYVPAASWAFLPGADEDWELRRVAAGASDSIKVRVAR